MMARPQRKRAGVTLVDVLVVIVLTALVLSLLLPAVQKVRDAAARAQCTNNLKQIGLALHGHLDLHRCFPTGGQDWSQAPTYVAPGQPAVGSAQKASWLFAILPFLEQTELYEGNGATTIAQCQRNVISTPVPTYFCPARRPASTLPPRTNWYPPLGCFPHAPTDYAGSDLHSQRGVIRRASTGPTLLREVRDGISNCILAGEAHKNVCRLGQYQADENEGYTAGWDWDTMRPAEVPLRQDDCNEPDSFGAPHLTGVNFVFADGTVRMLAYDLPPLTLQTLAWIDDGQAALPEAARD